MEKKEPYYLLIEYTDRWCSWRSLSLSPRLKYSSTGWLEPGIDSKDCNTIISAPSWYICAIQYIHILYLVSYYYTVNDVFFWTLYNPIYVFLIRLPLEIAQAHFYPILSFKCSYFISLLLAWHPIPARGIILYVVRLCRGRRPKPATWLVLYSTHQLHIITAITLRRQAKSLFRVPLLKDWCRAGRSPRTYVDRHNQNMKT